jgi:ComF family protein
MACSKDAALLCAYCINLLPDAESVCFKCHKSTDNYSTCIECSKIVIPRAVHCGTDYEFIGKKLIHNLKFDHTYEAADLIARHLSTILPKIPRNTFIVPLPTAPGRIRQRGFDQSVLIAKQLSKITKLPYVDALVRVDEARQTSLSRHERLSRIETTFTYRHKYINKLERVLLVDDVMSTGATIESAAIACSRGGVKEISATVFAVNRKL